MAKTTTVIEQGGKGVEFIASKVRELIRLGFPESTAKKIASGELPMDSMSRAQRSAEQGHTIDAYHGANRLDRVLEKPGLDPKRATSGPMPFMTDSPELASSYARGKSDTSMGEADIDYSNWFKVSAGSGRPKRVTDAWYYLNADEKAEVMERLPKVAFDDEAENLVMADGLSSRDHWEYTLRQHNGNPLAAAKDLWLDGGNLFGDEERFIEVLRMGGLKRPIKWDSPQMEVQGILPAKLKMNSPLDTGDAESMQAVLGRLREAGKGKRYKQPKAGVDQWDKNTIGIKEFADKLEQDIADGTTFAWTSIPDDVTNELRAMGFDGIKDTGGKGGGVSHNVYIPFESSQVRSPYAAFDPDQKDSSNLLAGLGAGAVGIGLAGQSEDADAGVITKGGKRIIEAFHGSPHKFDKFSMDAIGTGEGAQAYGHGLYFADSEDVAREYRKRLTPDRSYVVDGKNVHDHDLTPIQNEALHDIAKYGYDDAVKYANDFAEMFPSNPKHPELLAEIQRVGDSASVENQVGALYRAHIDVDPDTLLDWDKPLSEQSEAVQSLFAKADEDEAAAWIQWFNNNDDVKSDWADLAPEVRQKLARYYEREGMQVPDLLTGRKNQITGERFYSELHDDPVKAAKYLREHGIPGIRYADGMSRGKDGGTYNYVMFDDKPISIQERGNASPEMLALTTAAGGFLAARQEKSSQWDALRADLLTAVSGAAEFGLEAIDIPWKGILGASRVAGGLASGESFNDAMFSGANQVRQPVEQTADQLGGAVVDYTGSPALGTAVNVGVNLGGPI